MELHSATTRFALACNQSSKIIEPIQSRCAIVRFMKLSNEEVLKRAKWVAEQEGVAYDPSGLEAITFTADGDMRQALNNLQATVAGFGFVNQVCLKNMPYLDTSAQKQCAYHFLCIAACLQFSWARHRLLHQYVMFQQFSRYVCILWEVEFQPSGYSNVH